jgi:[acyl-carrier-protein] S-malonyltransferase
MPTTAFLFPGQGSQYVGMGADLYEQFPEARAVIDEAADSLPFPLKDLMFGAGGDPEVEKAALTETHVTQPALYVHSLAAFAVLDKHGHAPDMTAGHSLGEYSALAAAGALSFSEGLALVKLRGELMNRAGDERPGTMSAVLGMDADALERLCEEVTEAGEGVVQCANFNAPGQIVISGDNDAVARAGEGAKEAGARRVVPLPVGGAFHSPLMAYARDGLATALETAEITAPRCPVYLNVTARPTTDPDEIRRRLLDQLTAPVRWAQSLEAMRADGADHFVEVGAGKVLAGLVKRTLGHDVDTATAGTADELANPS